MPYAGYSNTEQWDQSIIRRFCSSNHWRSQIANLVVPLTRLTQALLLLILLSVGWPARADYWAGIAAFVRSDYQTARAEWQALAEQGHSEARFNLGALYDEGLGVERDYAQAVLWYRRAAEQGHSKAQFNLAVLYANGLGVAVNKTEAARWYQQAANQGQVEAQFNLAVLYEDGDGVPQNDVLAAEWYRQAAQQGHAVAQNNLGILYANGRGMPQPAHCADGEQLLLVIRKDLCLFVEEERLTAAFFSPHMGVKSVSFQKSGTAFPAQSWWVLRRVFQT